MCTPPENPRQLAKIINGRFSPRLKSRMAVAVLNALSGNHTYRSNQVKKASLLETMAAGCMSFTQNYQNSIFNYRTLQLKHSGLLTSWSSFVATQNSAWHLSSLWLDHLLACWVGWIGRNFPVHAAWAFQANVACKKTGYDVLPPET